MHSPRLYTLLWCLFALCCAAKSKKKATPYHVPPYIQEPNGATCHAVLGFGGDRFARKTTFYLNTTGDWAGHDWGRAFHEALKADTGCWDVHQFKFEYYNATGDWHDRTTRNYSEPGTGPAWASFFTGGLKPECVERPIQELTRATGQVVYPNCTVTCTRRCQACIETGLCSNF